MLKAFFRHAAPPARAGFFWASALWACAWSPLTPAAYAAEAAPPEAAAPPFRHYQGWRDEPLQDWREANDRVGAVGGWRTYLRESQQQNDNDAEHAHHGH